MRVFGPNGPSPYRAERNRQLDALLPPDDADDDYPDPFAGLTERWYDHNMTHRQLLLDYMIRHAEHFRFTERD
jgi:hypothetical protein